MHVDISEAMRHGGRVPLRHVGAVPTALEFRKRCDAQVVVSDDEQQAVPTALISRKRCDSSIIFIAMTRCFAAFCEHERHILEFIASCAAIME